jgi:protein-S-isoprenylcysteine O-methyltransferase Ste14
MIAVRHALSQMLSDMLSRPRRTAVALLWGGACHAVFALAVAAMIAAMWWGMSRSLGPYEGAAAWIANALLLAQFPLGHSLLLTPRGQRVLAALAPAPHGRTLATTTYALIASAQLLLLFVCWSPSGVVWWRAEGGLLWAMTALYGASWLLLMKASFDAGPTVQSGLLGWWSLLRGVKPVFPPMPERGLFRIVRQPIYAAFALTLWTAPTWTPDQLFLAVAWTGYCLLAPLHKERRFDRMFGARWRAYRARTPYWLPLPRRRTDA